MFEEEPRKGFIEELQGLEAPVKKRVLIVSTSIIMAVVVYVWLGYFNNIIANAPAAALAENATSTPTSSAPGFFDRIGGGGAYMLRAFGSWADSAANALKSPRQYIIKP